MSQDPPAQIRFTEPGDSKHLKEWLEDDGVNRWFPMYDAPEIEDAVQRWISFSRYRCSLTAVLDGLPVGIATLYLQPYRKLAHQCEFGIIVAPAYRNRGIGNFLLEQLEKLAKDTFKIELIHLQVYQDNPAKHLYERRGYEPFGDQKRWIKEINGTYTGRTFMQKDL